MKSYDFSRAKAYFVTVCTYNRECIPGNITNSEMRLSKYGKIVETVWHGLINHYDPIELGESVIMPNHIHGIIILQDAVGEGLKPSPTMRRHALTEIIRGLKTFSSRDINSSRNTPGKRVWQRSYHDHVIRSETDLQSIREYIVNNPLPWYIDNENPEKLWHSR